ncbi:anti-sigma factor family protein [Pseudomonas sp. KNUC1026]|uniref:anti-sigma factor family protein n=1 Tax=Pseudomonas sp. KNUC1026 TaxID=2893890 RepID=UPI001F21D955|nr:anti-sigma factor [Pseudomonas sp. KNUC1026]UFH50854.1 anti-sigma factor [Pseudomonas sp. KNUC1026]
MITLPPSEQSLHAWVDGRLNEADRQALDAWLAQHPEVARRVQAWRNDAQHLRAALGGALAQPANPALDPAALRQRLRQHRHRHLARAASLVLALGVGALAGWNGRAMQTPAFVPMGDALEAYRLFAQQGMMPADMTAKDPQTLQHWLDQHFARAQRLPDLDTAGLRPVAARLLSTDQGAAAMVLYEGAHGEKVSFYIRPPGPRHNMLGRGSRQDGELQADYWSGAGFNYAVVSRAGSMAPATLARLQED